MNGGLPSRGRAGDVHDWGPPPHRPVHNTVLPSADLAPVCFAGNASPPFLCVFTNYIIKGPDVVKLNYPLLL